MLNAKEPPESNVLRFILPVPPISRQARGAARQAMVEAVKEITRPLEYILDVYLYVDLNWILHQQVRRETDASADVDNIVKPLLDALSGPDGVMVDDSQVRSFTSVWMSGMGGDERVQVQIEFIDKEYLRKDRLVFVQLEGPMCYPVPYEVREKGVLAEWIGWLQVTLQTKQQLQGLGADWDTSAFVVPHGFFHRTRLKGFPVYTRRGLNLRSDLRTSAQDQASSAER